MNDKKVQKQADKHHLVCQLARGIYQIWLPLSMPPVTDLDHMHAYLIEGNTGWWLLDTGWNVPETFQALQQALNSLKIKFTDINTILLSHSHPDHYGLAGRIKQLSPQTQIVLHRLEADNIEWRYVNFVETENGTEAQLESHGVPKADLKALASASLPTLELVTIVKPDRLLSDGEIIHTGVYDLKAFWTPGHSPGHLCFYESQNQFFFSGDHILPTVTPNVSSNIISGENPLGGYIETLNRLAHLPVKEVHPGHEYSFTGLPERIQEILEHHQQREDEIYNVITKSPCTAYDIASRLTWHVRGKTWDQFNPWFKRMATTEVVAHLNYMQSKSRIHKQVDSNHFLYSIH